MKMEVLECILVYCQFLVCGLLWCLLAGINIAAVVPAQAFVILSSYAGQCARELCYSWYYSSFVRLKVCSRGVIASKVVFL